MKRTRQLILLAIALALSSSTMTERANAKPAYCDTAYWGCRDDCVTYFSWLDSKVVAACQYSCYLGWQNCGSN